MKKLFLCLLMLLCCAAVAVAEDTEVETYTDGAYEYILTEDGAVITDYLWSDTLPDVIEVPVSLGGMPVVGFEYVFASGDWRQHEVKIVIPEGITTVGNAFVECTEVTEIVLPASMEHIPEDSFTWVDAEIILHPDNPHFANENGFLIDQRTNTLLYTAPSAANLPLPEVSRLGDHCLWNWHPSECVVLPESLTSIGRGVCYEWMDTTSIIIPDSVTEIGAGAFNCAGLTSIDLPDGLTNIPELMLSCTEITEITIPESVKSIGGWAFYLCPLTRVEIPATCTFVALDAFDPEVELIFHGEGQLETENEYAERTGHNYWLDDEDEQTEPETHTDGIYEYTLTDEGAVLTDCDWAFYDDEQPDTIELPSTLGGYPVVGIGHSTLCTYMDMDANYDFTLIIPEGVKWLSDDTFWCCHNANVIHFPASLTNIPEGCFDHVWATFVVAEDNPRYEVRNGFLIDVQTDTIIYTEVNCGDNPIPAVRRIGAGSMDNWGTEWGQDMVISEGVEEIGEYAFYDWELSHVTLPESLRLIESHAFNVGIIEPVILPAGVEMVQRWAFSGCGSEIEVIATSDATHFETAEEYEARTGYRHWMDDEDVQAEPETHTDGIYEYTLTDEGAVLTDWKWYTDGYVLPDVVELPAELGGQPVVGIGHNALNTSEMDAEDTFTLIVPEGVKWLDEVAFQCCHNADVIHIPASLTEIPEACFHHVWAEMVVADSNPRYVIQSGYLIDTQTDTLLYATSRSDGNPIPAVRRIGASSTDCWASEWGQELVIPEGVEEIGEYAFYDWEFSHVTLPESLRLIESNAFDIVITEPVILPAGVEMVQHWAFSGCGSEIEVIATSDATHFETADEYEARTGYRHWMDDWAEE